MPSSACQKCALRSEEHTSELQSHDNLVCRLLLVKKRKPKAFHDAKQDAEKKLAALEPRVLVITAGVDGSQGKSVTVTIDFFKISAAPNGLPLPPHPGVPK